MDIGIITITYAPRKLFMITDKHIAGETFWLNIAAENIYNTFEKRATSVKNLKAVIGWAYALFVTGGFILNVFGSIEKFNLTSLFLFGIAFLLLTFSYALASQAEYPVKNDYHPNDVSDISLAFSRAVRRQATFFNWAAALTLFGFFFLALGILYLFYNAKKPPEIVKTDLYPLSLKTSIEKKDTNYYIPLTLLTTPESKIDLAVIGANGTQTTLFNKEIQVDTSGRMTYVYDIADTRFDTFFVRAGVRVSEIDTVTERIRTVKVIKKK